MKTSAHQPTAPRPHARSHNHPAPSRPGAIKYILYARKSQEDQKRQVKSIDDQVAELRRLAADSGLIVIDEIREARTAKEPGRPLFDALLARVRAGEAQGILVWGINRLLRNPVDQGTVQWMLQQRQLLSIQTMDREHTPDDNVLILNVESGVANQFIIDLRKNTLRGMRSKVEAGWFPHRAPEGYVNEPKGLKGQRQIGVDPLRFPVLRQAWEKMLTGTYSVPMILQFLHDDGYRIRPHGHSRDQKMSRSALYRLFANRFYAGEFLHAGEWRPGKHTPMVTPDEFNRVQALLGKGTRVAPQKRLFAYGGGLMSCGRCGCQVCGEVKRRQTQSGVRLHTYYACSNGKRICNKKGTTEEALDEILAERLSEVSIAPRFRPLLLSLWRRHQEETTWEAEAVAALPRETLARKVRERRTLLSLRLQESIDDALFGEKKAELDAEIAHLEAVVQHAAGDGERGTPSVENVLWFATEPKERFRALPVEEKRLVVRALGRYTLTDGNVALEWENVLVPVRDHARALEADLAAFERADFGSESDKKAALDRLCSVWGSLWDDIRTAAVGMSLPFPALTLSSDAPLEVADHG